MPDLLSAARAGQNRLRQGRPRPQLFTWGMKASKVAPTAAGSVTLRPVPWENENRRLQKQVCATGCATLLPSSLRNHAADFGGDPVYGEAN